MRNVIKCSAIALAFVSAPAFAQEQAPSMGGFKLGALVGVDSVRVSDGVDSASDEGVVFGISTGYDYDLGSVVLGVEAELADSSVSETATDLLVAGDSAKLSAKRDVYVGARAGFKASARTLIYAKGGYTNAKAKLTYDDGTGALSGGDELDGYRVGGGVEFIVTPRMAIRGEYRFSDYGEYEFSGVNTGISVQRHQGVVTLLGKF